MSIAIILPENGGGIGRLMTTDAAAPENRECPGDSARTVIGAPSSFPDAPNAQR